MPQKIPQETPLALTWLCFIRDHGQDLKVTKEARVLASVLPTYGEGKRIFATMVTLARVTGMKRETVRNARRELEDKGLLEDITGDPGKQERTYRLAVPGYVVPERTTPKVVPERTTPKVVPERTTPGPPKDHPVVPERTTPGPLEDHNIKTENQEVDQAQHHHGLGDDDAGKNPPGKDQDQDQEPYVDWDSPDDGGWVAELLDVPVVSIGQPFRTWLEEFFISVDFDKDADFLALETALKRASEASNPVGYLRSILPGYVARHRAQRDTRAA